jgi:hypothetical protein
VVADSKGNSLRVRKPLADGSIDGNDAIWTPLPLSRIMT